MPQPTYQIHIKGHLDQRWCLWFEDFEIRHEFDATGKPVTCMTGSIPDQAALYGTISRLRDLGITLISVQKISKE